MKSAISSSNHGFDQLSEDEVSSDHNQKPEATKRSNWTKSTHSPGKQTGNKIEENKQKETRKQGASSNQREIYEDSDEKKSRR